MRASKQSKDVEIAAADGVPYASLTKAIEALNQAGLTEWALRAPSDLTSRPKK